MKKLDSITRTSIVAEMAHMSYGKFVAQFGVVPGDDDESVISGGKEQVCQECGRTFVPNRINMKFCSEECRHRCNNRIFKRRYRQSADS